jgi:glucose-1-phosphate cytidylyltransferase
LGVKADRGNMTEMKTVILAGGFGTRLSEETTGKPKPMAEVGGKPMLWHILSIYAAHGFDDFVIACGYRGEVIKDYFANFYYRNSDLSVDLGSGDVRTVGVGSPSWRVACIDTGLETMTGGRLLALKDLLTTSGTFMVTYGDGLADVDLARLVDFHHAHGKLATVTAVHPPPRFGAIEIEGDRVAVFSEKNPSDAGWINGGFFVFEPEVLNFIDGNSTRLEAEPLSRLAADGNLMAYRHDGFWKPMDTLREKLELETMWSSGHPPWKVW